jgi:IclR family acetate operon transcriptional repressor
MSDANYSIRSVQRVCDILDLVQANHDGLSLMDFAQATELPKSSVFRYLATLESRGYVERTEAGDYRMGLALNGDRIDTLTRRLTPQLVHLRDTLGETVNLGMLDGTRVAYLEIVESRASIRNAPRPAEREYLHATALGKVLAAQQPVELVESILRQEGMPPQTANTITNVPDYLVELDRVRAQGYALDNEENEIGGRCVAVLVPRTTLPVAVSLSAPTSRLTVEAAAEVARVIAGVIGRAAAFADRDAAIPTSEGANA